MRNTLLALIGLSNACAGSTETREELREVARLKAHPNRDLDLLFVVDNSLSMADKQASLAASFPAMMDVLATVDGGLPNLHIGVVTSDMGTSSILAPVGAGSIGLPDSGGCDGAGDDGILVQGANVTDRFIADVAGADGRVRNYTGELRDVFRELAMVGDRGCGFEQHLLAMRRALFQPANEGFLRAEANLAVVFLADEDDCSALDPALFAPDGTLIPAPGTGSGSGGGSGDGDGSGTGDGSGSGGGLSLGRLDSYRCARFGWECDQSLDEDGTKTNCRPRADSPLVADTAAFVEALRLVKPDPRMLMVSGITGAAAPIEVAWESSLAGYSLGLAPSCTSTSAVGETYVADPAVRLDAFVEAFGELGTSASICDGDFTFPLAKIAHTAKRMIADPCLDTTVLADSAAELPGVQPSCELVDVRDAAPDARTSLPPCSASDGDCYELVEDRAACPETADHLRVAIRRTGNVSADTWTHVACAVR